MRKEAIMKIIFLRSNAVNPDSRVEKEVASLLKGGHEVSILAWDRESKIDSKDILKFNQFYAPIYRFGIKSEFGAGFKKNILPLSKFQKCMLTWLFKNKDQYDVIHACDFDTAFIGYICAKLFSKKFVYDIFDYYVDAFNVPNNLKSLIEKIDRHIINNADAVIICTEKRKKQIIGTNPKYLEVIHNTPDSSLNLNESFQKQGTNDCYSLCYVGILQDGRFLKEIADIISKHQNIELHIGGFGKLEPDFKTLSKKYENIFYYGKLAYSDTLSLEKQCDLLFALYEPTIPNHIYSAPNKFYEALMLGKPILMFEETGFDSIINQFSIGETVEYSYEAVENKLLGFSNRTVNRQFNPIQIQEIYNKYFSWNVMEERLLKLYSNIIEGGQSD